MDLKERHSVLQQYLLHNDSSTVATEVPVWMWDKQLGAIHGHIDILQIRYGKIWILDYKPAAVSISKEKTASQLFWYAKALSFRAKIPLNDKMCAFFDEQICYEFNPCKVKLVKNDNSSKQEAQTRRENPPDATNLQ